MRSAVIGSLSAAAIAEDIAISDADIRIAFEDNLDEFRTPETRDIRQLVFDDKATANTARQQLDDGKDFAEVAVTMLDWSEADTNLGTVTQSALVTPLLRHLLLKLVPLWGRCKLLLGTIYCRLIKSRQAA